MPRPARMVLQRPRDPFQDRIDAALAVKNPPPKSTPTEQVIERKRAAMIRSLERVLRMLKGSTR